MLSTTPGDRGVRNVDPSAIGVLGALRMPKSLRLRFGELIPRGACSSGVGVAADTVAGGDLPLPALALAVGGTSGVLPLPALPLAVGVASGIVVLLEEAAVPCLR